MLLILNYASAGQDGVKFVLFASSMRNLVSAFAKTSSICIYLAGRVGKI